MPPKKIYKKENKSVSNEEALNLISRTIYKSDNILVIVESPSKCKKIESFLSSRNDGRQYRVIATKGHLYEVEGLKGIDTKKTFEPKYKISVHQKPTVKMLKENIEIASKVILATDGDREGETIAYHICLIFGLNIETTERIIFHEITEPAIIQAIENPQRINMDLVRAQQARCVLDIIVGFTLSPVLWQNITGSGENDNYLSAGRCQTPALRLIYDNYKERVEGGGFAPATDIFYKVYGYFFSKNYCFELDDIFSTESDTRNYLIQSAIFNHTYLKEESAIIKKSHLSPPQPLNTSALIQMASNKMSISPKETMKICQSLYQGGYITYMRTDSRKYAGTFIESVKKYIEKKYGKQAFSGNIQEICCGGEPTKKTVEPHEAIRPTHIEVSILPENMSPREKSLYKHIYNHTLESCMCEAVYDIRKIYITAPQKKRYVYTIEKPVSLGWKMVSESREIQNTSAAQNLFFDNYCGNVVMTHIDAFVSVKSGHSHYTEASLVKKLEEIGIGRPSTFSTLIDTIITRGYVKKADVEGKILDCVEFRLNAGEKEPIETITKKEFSREKNKLVIQKVGITAIEFLLLHFSEFFSYDYTSTMEKRLDIVAQGNEVWNSICKDCYSEIKGLITKLKKEKNKSYYLDENHDVYFSAKRGPLIKYIPDRNNMEEEKTQLKSIRPGITIDIERLENGKYTLADLAEIPNECLGMYEDTPLYIKKGSYGVYIEWGNNRESLKNIGIPTENITIADIDKFLKDPTKEQLGKNVIRKISPDISIRRGKYGPYIFYKTMDMENPRFIGIKKSFKDNYMTCSVETILEYINSGIE